MQIKARSQCHRWDSETGGQEHGTGGEPTVGSSVKLSEPANDILINQTIRVWQPRCPAHNDREPSLSIRQAEDGTVPARCHAGREQARVITALRSLAANGYGLHNVEIRLSSATLELAFIWKRT